MQVHLAEHLPKNERIQLGSYYTPERLVKLVHEFIKPYLENNKNAILFDSAGGCNACNFLKQYFEHRKVFHTNSLKEVNRDKYSIPSSAFLIMIGNPPYNDTTSQFKKGR